MKFNITLAALFFMSASAACASFKTYAPLPTAENVSLEKYSGKWYAVTALPQLFTLSCAAQTADYAVVGEGKISVLNTCLKKNGKTTDIEGFAKTTDVSGVLNLRFTEGFPGFFGIEADYNIIKLDRKYRYALIGGRNRKSLWLLSRTKEISDKVYDEYIGRAAELGFKVSKLRDSNFVIPPVHAPSIGR